MDAAPIIVSATFAPADFAWLDGLRRAHFPPARNVLSAHLTLFHHLPPSVADELDRRLRDAVAVASPVASVSGVRMLGRGVALNVVSPVLEAIRADLAEAFTGMLTPQDQAGWRPHVTVQNKVEPHEAKALHALLSAERWPRPLRIAGLASYWYRGGPWEAIRAYRFRG